MLYSMLKDYVVVIFTKRSVIKSVASSLVAYMVLMTTWLLPLPQDIRAIKLFHPAPWVWITSILIGLAVAQFLAFKELWDKWHKLDVERGMPDPILDYSPLDAEGRKCALRVQNTVDSPAIHVSLSRIDITTSPTAMDFEIDDNPSQIIPSRPQRVTVDCDELQNVVKGSPAFFNCRATGVGPLHQFDLLETLAHDARLVNGNITHPVILRFSGVKGNNYEVAYDLELDYFRKSIFCRRKGSCVLVKW